jgi:hypothetical protein
VDAYAVTMHTDLVRGGAALDAAAHTDLSETALPSATRRAFHHIEAARAYHLAGDRSGGGPVAVVHLLKRAWEISPETVAFNRFARGAAADLSQTGSAVIRDDARALARHLGVAV